MWSLFTSAARWKWDGEGVPSKKVLKTQRQVLHSGSDDSKKRLLEHIVDLADRSEELQTALGHAKITADVCGCFLSGSAPVQTAAANALAALCDEHLGNCTAVLAAHHGSKKPLPLATKLLEHKNIDLALAAAGLLDVLAASDSSAVLQYLNQSSCIEDLFKRMRTWSQKALAASEPAAPTYMKLLRRLLRVLQSVATTVGVAKCRELFKAQVVALLLEFVQDYRGRQGLLPAAGEASESGSLSGHAAVVRDALYLLFLVLSQVPAHRVKLQEVDGVQRLLAVLRELGLPWSVRLQALAALTASASSPAVAEDVRKRGLDTVVCMVNAFVSGRLVPGAPESATTPVRATGVPGTPVTPAPASPANSAFGSPMAASATGSKNTEPRTAVVVEQLLGLLDAVTRVAPSTELLEERRFGALLAALDNGLSSFTGHGYRVATAAAQVMFRLSCCSGNPMHRALRGAMGSLQKLVTRAQEYTAAASARDAQVLHGAWCAVGLLSKALDEDQQQGAAQQQQVLSGTVLRLVVRFLEASAPAVLVAVGAAPPPYAAHAAPIWQTPGVHAADGMRPDGRAYLAKERVGSDLKETVTLLLQLLWGLVQRLDNQPTLRDMGVVEAVMKLLPWQQVQWRVKRLMHLLGELEVEYKPFTAYGGGPLLAAVLSSLRLDPQPFIDQGVDALVLLQLDDSFLRQALGLNDTGVLKVARIRDAHMLFSAIDAEDGKVDGCVTGADIEKYLTGVCSLRLKEAQSVCTTMLQQLQVLPGDPVNFLQFLTAYPSLTAVLEPIMPKRQLGLRSPGGAAGAGGAAAAAGTTDGDSVRLWKRQRVGVTLGS